VVPELVQMVPELVEGTATDSFRQLRISVFLAAEHVEAVDVLGG